jgi:hypothetical protein
MPSNFESHKAWIIVQPFTIQIGFGAVPKALSFSLASSEFEYVSCHQISNQKPFKIKPWLVIGKCALSPNWLKHTFLIQSPSMCVFVRYKTKSNEIKRVRAQISNREFLRVSIFTVCSTWLTAENYLEISEAQARIFSSMKALARRIPYLAECAHCWWKNKHSCVQWKRKESNLCSYSPKST